MKYVKDGTPVMGSEVWGIAFGDGLVPVQCFLLFPNGQNASCLYFSKKIACARVKYFVRDLPNVSESAVWIIEVDGNS